MNRLLKWGVSALRILACRASNAGRLRIASGRPLYLGKGARIQVAEGGSCELGSGVYLSRSCLLQVNEGARLVVENNVFLNENVRVVAQEDVRIGEGTLFGPNVCVYDHDHVFDADGVHAELASKPVSIGRKCWIAANSLITRGVSIEDKTLVGGGLWLHAPWKVLESMRVHPRERSSRSL